MTLIQIRKVQESQKNNESIDEPSKENDPVIDYPKFLIQIGPYNIDLIKSYIILLENMILIFYQPYLEKTFDPNCIPLEQPSNVERKLNLNSTKVNLVRRRDKQNFAMNNDQPCILIDDYDKNTHHNH